MLDKNGLSDPDLGRAIWREEKKDISPNFRAIKKNKKEQRSPT